MRVSDFEPNTLLIVSLPVTEYMLLVRNRTLVESLLLQQAGLCRLLAHTFGPAQRVVGSKHSSPGPDLRMASRSLSPLSSASKLCSRCGQADEPKMAATTFSSSPSKVTTAKVSSYLLLHSFSVLASWFLPSPLLSWCFLRNHAVATLLDRNHVVLITEVGLQKLMYL